MKYRIIMLAAAALVCWTAEAKVPLEIVGGTHPTTLKMTRIIGKTEPGATAMVNNQPVKVYATGCFGAEVELKQGLNDIKVYVKKGDDYNEQVVHVACNPQKQTPPKVEPVMRDVMFNVTTLPGAFLQYGNGTDRLGGSKMGYIDADIPLRVVGDYDNLYKVQLAQNRFAYIQKEYAKMADVEVKTVNTSSISYSNIGKRDRVNVYLPCRLPYSSVTQLDPTAICVDIYGAMNNSNWISQHGDLGIIDYVDFRQLDSDVFRVFIKLKTNHAWGYHVEYKGNTLVIDVKHEPNLTLKGMTIGLDAGHGGDDSPGAIGHSGLEERTINLQLVNLVKGMLEATGAKVVLSRDGDYGVSMADRRKVFVDADVDLMLAVHNNSGGSPLEDQGSSTYYKYTTNRPLAATMLKHLTGIGLKNSGLTGNFNFSLGMTTECPNALLEVLFMSSLPDEEKLCNDGWRKKIASSIVAGVEDYLQQCKSNR